MINKKIAKKLEATKMWFLHRMLGGGGPKETNKSITKCCRTDCPHPDKTILIILSYDERILKVMRQLERLLRCMSDSS